MNQTKQLPTLPNILPDDDGYTLTRYIAAEERMYPELLFSYRPLSPKNRARVIDRRDAVRSEEKSIVAFSNVCAKQLVSWNAIDSHGKEAELSSGNILALHPIQQSRLFAIVIFSSEGGDANPYESSLDGDDWLQGDAEIIEGEQGN